MCGITGIIGREKLSEKLHSAVSRVNNSQIHRGPDGVGEFSSENILLAMRRLAIIDKKGGTQPLFNEDKSLVLIFNGEIYNYIELRERLKNLGHSFQTDTDGEVILHLYEEDNVDFIQHLRGMFAFALWDVKRRRLILARDRMGEKPLYLFEGDGFLLFASELKGLLKSGLIPFELDAHAINLYFHYQYVPEPLAAIKGVRKLDAARMLTIDVDNWQLTETEYWRMEDCEALSGNPRDLIRQQLEEVSSIIVRSDVAVGTALSGGLDSSIVAAFASQQTESLCAFSVGYQGRPECDEREDALALAKYLKLPFYEVELKTQQIVESFPQLNYWRDDPIADIAGFGYYAVMKLAREHGVSVMLQGQGGDELFWGYSQLRDAVRENQLKSALIRQPILQSLIQTMAFPGWRSSWKNVQNRLKNQNQLAFYDLNDDFKIAELYCSQLYSTKFLEQIMNSDVKELFTFPHGLESAEIKLTKLVCDTYLRGNGIVQGDRLGMASSVEMRLPLVDYRFVETIVGLRKTQSDSGFPPKYWLKEAVKGVLPDWVLNRPKRGFAPPTDEWHVALFDTYGKSLIDGHLVQQNILNAEGAKLLSTGNSYSQGDKSLPFKALVLEQWCRQMS